MTTLPNAVVTERSSNSFLGIRAPVMLDESRQELPYLLICVQIIGVTT